MPPESSQSPKVRSGRGRDRRCRAPNGKIVIEKLSASLLQSLSEWGGSQSLIWNRSLLKQGTSSKALTEFVWFWLIDLGWKTLNDANSWENRLMVEEMPPVSDLWYLYLIECRSGAYYAGITNNLEARYQAHSSGKGARYTRANPPVRLLGYAAFPDRSSASKAEWTIKQMPREEKITFLKCLGDAASGEKNV